MTNPRLDPPFWRHDAYTLRRLSAAVRNAIALVSRSVRGGTVVDMGAGDAPYRELFPASIWSYVCCDLSADSEVILEPGRPIPLPDGSAALVVSFQVLEHVWNLDWYLGEAKRLLSADGRLILSTHGVWLFHPHPEDFRRWTRPGLERELTERGFVVEAVLPVVGPLAWTTQFRTLGIVQLMRRIPLLGVPLASVTAAFMTMRMMIEDAATPAQWITDNAAAYVLVARRKVDAGKTAP
jgi:SAM-dependent methyltransferase